MGRVAQAGSICPGQGGREGGKMWADMGGCLALCRGQRCRPRSAHIFTQAKQTPTFFIFSAAMRFRSAASSRCRSFSSSKAVRSTACGGMRVYQCVAAGQALSASGPRHAGGQAQPPGVQLAMQAASAVAGAQAWWRRCSPPRQVSPCAPPWPPAASRTSQGRSTSCGRYSAAWPAG